MAGIENSLAVIGDVKVLIVEGAGIAKTGISLSNIGHLIHVFAELKKISDESKNVLPELQDLQGQEIMQLASAGYQAIQEIVAAFKS